jgi:Integrase zinc binding domain
MQKTYERISRDYYFPRMRKVTEEVVTNCDLYQKSKAARHALYSTLKPLDVLDRAWKSVS